MQRFVTTLLFALACVLVWAPPATAQDGPFTRNWEKSKAQGNAPTYISDGTGYNARGIAYGMVDDGNGSMVERVFVASDANGAFRIYVADANNGMLLDSLDVSEVSTVGARDLNDVAVTNDGIIYACNEANNVFVGGGEEFKCYRWDSLTDAPTEVISFLPADADGDGTEDWVGSNITVTGSASDNSLLIHTAAVNNSPNLYQFSTSDNGSSFTPDTLAIGDSATVNVEDAYPTSSGIYHTVIEEPATLYNTDGDSLGAIPVGVADSLVSLQIFEVNGQTFLAGAKNNFSGGNPAGSNSRVRIANISQGASNATTYGQTPDLGDTQQFQGNGDVDVRVNDDGTATVFFLSTNNGVGSFTTNAAPLDAEPSGPAQFVRNWEFSENEGSVPTYVNNARALAVGTVEDSSGAMVKRMLVSHNTDDTFQIEVIDPMTGTSTGSLAPQGLVDVSRDLQDVAVTDDGVIVACNEVNNNFLTSNNETFTCYRWDSLADEATEIISFDPPDQDGGGQADWIGRLISVKGSFSNGSVTITTAASSLQGGTPDNVYRFTQMGTSSNAKAVDFAVEVVDRSGDETTQGLNAVEPLAAGSADFIYNPAAAKPRLYGSDGTLQASVPDGVVSNFSHSTRYFEVGSRAFFATFNWETGGVGQKATVVEVTDGVDSALPLSSTPSMGSGDANPNGTGDLAVDVADDGTTTLYVLATGTGIGSYTSNKALPVELAAFNATRDGNTVQLTWQTASETNNAGFYVQRAVDGETFADLGFREGRGTTTEAQTYRFTDRDLPYDATTVQYRLRQVDTDGSAEFSDAVSVRVAAPDAIQLLGSTPHPVTQQGQIRYALPQTMDVELAVFDLLGRRVATLASGEQQGRRHVVQVDVSDLSSGTYFIRLKAGDQVKTRRLTVVQ
jgi:hypothetical protein